MQRIGVVLGGGGVRSMAHIGVLRELQKLGLPIHHVAGTSAGAIIGALFAAGNSLDRLERIVRELTWRHIFEPSLLWRGSMSGTRLMNYLERLLGEHRTFESLRVPLAVTAVELRRGRRVVFNEGPLLPAIRASIALPGAIHPVPGENGALLVDGGVLGSVPTDVLRAAGCDVVIAVDVRVHGALEESAQGALSRRRTALLRRVGEVMSYHLTDLGLEDADIVIRPAVDGIGAFQVSRIGRCIDAGTEAARDVRERLARYVPGAVPEPPPEPEIAPDGEDGVASPVPQTPAVGPS